MKFSTRHLILILIATAFFACQTAEQQSSLTQTAYISTEQGNDTMQLKSELVEYAKTLQGIPYKYGSTDPTKGFDCSGFITYVFNHFKMKVPRSSVEFTNYGEEIPKDVAVPGDLILFTGTDSNIRTVGHMGIIVQNGVDGILFIHSTSGKEYSVTITPLNKYYMGRFVKTTRVIE